MTLLHGVPNIWLLPVVVIHTYLSFRKFNFSIPAPRAILDKRLPRLRRIFWFDTRWKCLMPCLFGLTSHLAAAGVAVDGFPRSREHRSAVRELGRKCRGKSWPWPRTRISKTCSSNNPVRFWWTSMPREGQRHWACLHSGDPILCMDTYCTNMPLGSSAAAAAGGG